MRFAVLGSGSKGNCLVIDGGGAIVLVDAGYGPREIRARLRHLDLDLADVDALLVTHGHGDHVKGARQLAGALQLPTYATEATRRFASTFTTLKHHVRVDPGTAFAVGGLTVHPVKTEHDEPGSVAYVIDDGDHAFAICTDLGTPAVEVGRALHGVDSLVLEFNHDRRMLLEGPYPAHLKRRVGSRFGHLRNEDGATLLAMARSTALSRVLCAHLSEVNNTPAKALDAARPVLDGADVDLACAPQHAPTEWLRVRRRPVTRVRAALPSTPGSADRAGTDAPPAPDAVADAEVVVVSRPAATTRAPTEAAPALPPGLQRQMALFGAGDAAATTKGAPPHRATTQKTTTTKEPA